MTADMYAGYYASDKEFGIKVILGVGSGEAIELENNKVGWSDRTDTALSNQRRAVVYSDNMPVPCAVTAGRSPDAIHLSFSYSARCNQSVQLDPKMTGNNGTIFGATVISLLSCNAYDTLPLQVTIYSWAMHSISTDALGPPGRRPA